MILKERCHFRFSLDRLALTSASALLFFLSGDLAAQQTNELSTVVVSIRDPGGAAIPGAYVKLFPHAASAMATTSDGVFSFTAKPGKYDLFVEVAGFREVAKHMEVRGGERTVVNLTLRIGGCPPGPCLTVMPWDPAVVLSVSDDESHALTLRAADLKLLKRLAVVLNSPESKAKERYSGFSLAEVLEKFCGAAHCAPGNSSSPAYAVASGTSEFIVFPVTKLMSVTPEDKIVIADALGGTPLPNNGLRAFLIEDGRVTESVRGIIGIRLVSPH